MKLAEFFVGLAAGTNLFFYPFFRGVIEVALGARSLLPLRTALPALGLLAAGLLYYTWRLIVLPGKLVRGEV